MKKILLALITFAVVFAGCGDDNVNDNGNNNQIKINTSLKITNHTGYDLFDVEYSSVKYGDMSIGVNKTMDVTSGSPNPIYFYLSVNNNRIQCRTDEVIIIDNGNAEERVLQPSTVIRTVTGGINGSISSVYIALSKPIFELSRNNTVINNDAPLPIDFGRIEIVTSSLPFIFTIKNIGNLPLELNGTPAILSSNPVFSIQSQPANTSINPGASAAFIVIYTPTVEKEDNGTITIMNNSDDLVFSLKVKGTGFVSVPQISVKQGNDNITPAGEYNFGSVVSGGIKDVTFSIENIGGADLIFTTVNNNRINLSENIGNAFSITQQPSTAVIPGSSTNFLIRFAPAVGGSSYSANVRIKTNSRNNDEFVITLKGSCHDVIPSVPTGVVATGETTAGRIRVSWNSVTGATSYKVYYGTSSSSVTILAITTSTNSYSHSGLPNGTRYYYRVVATNSSGDSDYSNIVFGTTKCAAPTGIIASTDGKYNTVRWSSVSGASNYNFYYTTGSSISTKIYIGDSNNSPFYHDYNRFSATYYYFVTAVNADGIESDFSSASNALVRQD